MDQAEVFIAIIAVVAVTLCLNLLLRCEQRW
jgi:hypothetical protein